VKLNEIEDSIQSLKESAIDMIKKKRRWCTPCVVGRENIQDRFSRTQAWLCAIVSLFFINPNNIYLKGEIEI